MLAKQTEQQWKRWLSPTVIMLCVLVGLASKAGFWSLLG